MLAQAIYVLHSESHLLRLAAILLYRDLPKEEINGSLIISAKSLNIGEITEPVRLSILT